MSETELMHAAVLARDRAYAPYSRFRVGAALLCADGSVYEGCNIENASYGATCCAERTAFFRAVSEGKRAFTAIAIAGGLGDTPDPLCAPCGICRQVMAEFCAPDFRVLLGNDALFTVYSLSDLLPLAFTGESL